MANFDITDGGAWEQILTHNSIPDWGKSVLIEDFDDAEHFGNTFIDDKDLIEYSREVVEGGRMPPESSGRPNIKVEAMSRDRHFVPYLRKLLKWVRKQEEAPDPAPAPNPSSGMGVFGQPTNDFADELLKAVKDEVWAGLVQNFNSAYVGAKIHAKNIPGPKTRALIYKHWGKNMGPPKALLPSRSLMWACTEQSSRLVCSSARHGYCQKRTATSAEVGSAAGPLWRGGNSVPSYLLDER